MTGAVAQVRALAWMRWQMMRGNGARVALCAAPLVLTWFTYLAMRTATSITEPALVAATELAPAAFLGFAVLAVIAPLTAGGGIELLPSSQLVAFPVRPRTVFLSGLLLAPANLVWVVQLLVLAAETSYLTIGGGPAAGGLTALTFVACLTVVGQAIAWTVVGLRQTRVGRRIVGVLIVVALIAIALVVRLGYEFAALRLSPTRTVVRAIEEGPGPRWALTTAGLLIGCAAAVAVGFRACAWAISRPNDATTAGTSVAVRRRPAKRSALAELVAVDRASVWRATALRRGGLVLAALPAAAAIGAAVPWPSLVVLPGLIAAGAGLLFGVNAFSLDGSGAVWLASLPHDPRLVARAKLHVLVETVAGAILVVLLAGSLRSPGTPTVAQLTAIVGSAVACGVFVVASCMALSVRRPHRADLNGPRDAVAPPGALTAASARLALPAALIGFVLEASSRTHVWWVPIATAAPIVGVALLWLNRSLARYADPHVRSHIVQTVAAG